MRSPRWISGAPTHLRGHRLGARIAFAVTMTSIAGIAWAATSGALLQLPGTDACVSNDGTGGDCADGRGLSIVAGVAVSRDGKNVYATGNFPGGIAVFLRNAFTGGLVQLSGSHGCIVNAAGSDVADCDNTGRGLSRARAIAVSPDGRHVYATATFADSGLAAFARDPEQLGALVQLSGSDGCINETGADGCAIGRALGFPIGVAVSPDGRHVYAAAAGSSAIVVFARDKTTGRLTQLPDPDGCLVDASAPITGCTNTARALSGPESVAISRDGRSVYAVSLSSAAITVFARDKTTGKLAQLPGPAGCVVDAAGAPIAGCDQSARGLAGAGSVAVSKDGRNVYVAADGADAVTTFARDKHTGALTQLTGADGCIVDGASAAIAGCDSGGKALSGAGHSGGTDLAVSPDGRSVYVAALFSNAVAAFSRDARTGKLTQLAGSDACVSNDGNGGLCSDGKGLRSAGSVAVGANGRSVYVGSELDPAVAVFAR